MSRPERNGGTVRRRFLAGAAASAAVGVGRNVRAEPPAGSAARDVKSFGAAGDGKADDTRALQAALDAAAASGGGMVVVPAGVYSTRTLQIGTGVHLVGAGIEATVLKLRAETNMDLIRSRGFAALTGTNRPEGPFNWSIRNLTLDGNRARNTRGCGLRLYAFGYVLSDVRIRQCADAGLASEWSIDDPVWTEDGLGTPGDSMEAQIVNLKVHHCGRGGIIFRGPHDSQFANIIVYDTRTSGIHVQSGKTFSATGCQFVNGHVWGSHEYAWKIEAGFVTLENCVGEWAAKAQVHLNDGDTTISAGRFFGSNKYRHVGIEIGSPEVVVYGSQIDARMSDLTGGAFKFTNEGGSSKIKALVYQTQGVPYTGTPARGSLLELLVNGVEGGSATVFPRGSLSWNGGAPIVRHLSGTAAWQPPELPQGATAGTTVNVAGAQAGDTVAVGFSQGIPVGALLVGTVSAPETVAVTLWNQTGRTLHLAPGTLRADCWVH